MSTNVERRAATGPHLLLRHLAARSPEGVSPSLLSPLRWCREGLV